MGGWEFSHLEVSPGLKAQVVWEASATSATGSCWPGREVVIRGLWGPILGRREWSLDEKPLIAIIDDRVLAWHQQNSSYIFSDGNHLKNPKDETFNLLRIASSVAVVDPIWVFLKDEDVSWKLWGTPPWNEANEFTTEKCPMVGRWICFWDGLFFRGYVGYDRVGPSRFPLKWQKDIGREDFLFACTHESFLLKCREMIRTWEKEYGIHTVDGNSIRHQLIGT